MLHPVGQMYSIVVNYFLCTSIYVRTHYVASDAHVKYSSMHNYVLFHFSSANTLTCARLPPVTNPPRTYVSPAGRFDVNEKKTTTLRKAARGPPPPPWPSINIHHTGRQPRRTHLRQRQSLQMTGRCVSMVLVCLARVPEGSMLCTPTATAGTTTTYHSSYSSYYPTPQKLLEHAA